MQERPKFLYRKAVQAVHPDDKGFEVKHLDDSIEDARELISIHAAVIKKHSVYNFVVQILACLS